MPKPDYESAQLLKEINRALQSVIKPAIHDITEATSMDPPRLHVVDDRAVWIGSIVRTLIDKIEKRLDPGSG